MTLTDKSRIEFEQSENISNSYFANIFHGSEYIGRRKIRARIEGFNNPFILALFAVITFQDG